MINKAHFRHKPQHSLLIVTCRTLLTWFFFFFLNIQLEFWLTVKKPKKTPNPQSKLTKCTKCHRSKKETDVYTKYSKWIKWNHMEVSKAHFQKSRNSSEENKRSTQLHHTLGCSWQHRSFYFQWQNLNPRSFKAFFFRNSSHLAFLQATLWLKAWHSWSPWHFPSSMEVISPPHPCFSCRQDEIVSDCISQKGLTQSYFNEKHYFAALQVLQDYLKGFLTKQYFHIILQQNNQF